MAGKACSVFAIVCSSFFSRVYTLHIHTEKSFSISLVATSEIKLHLYSILLHGIWIIAIYTNADRSINSPFPHISTAINI